MKYNIYLIFALLFVQISFGQNQTFIKHKVSKGENLTQIAKKYNVSVSDIVQNNPSASSGLALDSVLNIPNKGSNKSAKKHTVSPKETLYSISKLYNVTIDELTNANIYIKDGLQIGMVLNIPEKGKINTENVVKTNKFPETIYHEVQPKETKYSIANRYNISIENLEKLNPEIANTDLPVGIKLFISGTKKIDTAPISITPTKNVTTDYVVKPQETIYSICKLFNISQEDLLALNPLLKDGLVEGMMLKMPEKAKIFIPKADYKDLTKSIKNNANKKLALLLPFNLTKLDQDTINSTKARLKKDKFLNMTLDFYAGALMAIDSVKSLNLNVNIAIFDSNETKSSSNVSNVVENNNLQNFDAIIGPFYQNNVEKLASLLNAKNVPVFSPLSKDYDKKYANLIQTTPSANDLKNAMFDFMKSKNGNIIAVIDPKKTSVSEFISTNYIETQIVKFKENGALDVENLKSYLVKDKLNYVIMETEKTNLILSLTNQLSNLLANYNIHLVTLSENEALDYEEIPMSKLVKLKLHYPSLTIVNTAENSLLFEKNFKQKNKIAPNQFATRGFDLTFDVLLRLQQEKNIYDSLTETATEQVENKFNYKLNPDGSYTNKGVYILTYEPDFTIKEAK
jgi:LysM repeat protein